MYRSFSPPVGVEGVWVSGGWTIGVIKVRVFLHTKQVNAQCTTHQTGRPRTEGGEAEELVHDPAALRLVVLVARQHGRLHAARLEACVCGGLWFRGYVDVDMVDIYVGPLF